MLVKSDKYGIVNTGESNKTTVFTLLDACAGEWPGATKSRIPGGSKNLKIAISYRFMHWLRKTPHMHFYNLGGGSYSWKCWDMWGGGDSYKICIPLYVLVLYINVNWSWCKKPNTAMVHCNRTQYRTYLSFCFCSTKGDLMCLD